MKFKSRIVMAALTASGIVTAGVLVALPAKAWSWNNCFVGSGSSGYTCYYYHSNYGGAEVGINGDDPDECSPWIDFSYPNPYTGSTDGLGLGMCNDAGSAANGRTDCAAHIFYHASYMGTEVSLAPYMSSGYNNPTLGPDNNNNRSQKQC